MKTVLFAFLALSLRMIGAEPGLAKDMSLPKAGPKPNAYEKPIRAFLKRVQKDRLPTGLVTDIKVSIGTPEKAVCTTNGGKKREAWRIKAVLMPAYGDGAVEPPIVIYYWVANGRFFAGSQSSSRCVSRR